MAPFRARGLERVKLSIRVRCAPTVKALGREMLEYLPFVPLSEGIRIGVAILSYNGRLTFGVTGDYDTAPDVHFMAEQIEAEVRRLRARAGKPNTTTSGRRSKEMAR